MWRIPLEWLKDYRVSEQVRKMTAKSMGLSARTSREELQRVLRAHQTDGTAESLGQAPWCHRHSELSAFEFEFQVLWWNYYLLPWRRQELERHLDLVLPAWVLGRVKPCLW